jgi:hypothetical protein
MKYFESKNGRTISRFITYSDIEHAPFDMFTYVFDDMKKVLLEEIKKNNIRVDAFMIKLIAGEILDENK